MLNPLRPYLQSSCLMKKTEFLTQTSPQPQVQPMEEPQADNAYTQQIKDLTEMLMRKLNQAAMKGNFHRSVFFNYLLGFKFKIIRLTFLHQVKKVQLIVWRFQISCISSTNLHSRSACRNRPAHPNPPSFLDRSPPKTGD